MSTEITIADLQTAMPDQIKGKVTESLVNNLNSIAMDDEFRENYRENLISYTSVMQEGRFTIEQYLNAVRYVSYKVMGDTNVKAYMRTFPDKYSRFKTKGVKDKDIASYVTAYNKSKLVNLIYDQTMIPTHVLNADLFQKALNTQAELMMTAASEKVRSDAANSLLTHLKPPETKKLELEVTHKESSIVDDLRRATMEHAKVLKDSIASGASNAKEVAHGSLIIEGEFSQEDD
jgi:hypothetical protein